MGLRRATVLRRRHIWGRRRCADLCDKETRRHALALATLVGVVETFCCDFGGQDGAGSFGHFAVHQTFKDERPIVSQIQAAAVYLCLPFSAFGPIKGETVKIKKGEYVNFQYPGSRLNKATLAPVPSTGKHS
jgi:hypothetical protein